MEIEVHKGLQGMGIHVLSGVLEGITVKQTRKDVFKALCDELKMEMRERFRDQEAITRDRTVRALRDLYWRIGIDPTKTRPASEALLRRLLKKDLPTINTLVDSGNLASTKTLVPIGLYDVERIDGRLELRPAAEGERFIGIGGADEVLREGTPVLSDSEGILHLYPHRDCMRTRITSDCTSALVVACGASNIKQTELNEALLEVEYYFEQLSV